MGSIYALKYMYNCGLIGALLVHRSWRRVGIGTALLLKALTWLDLPYTYLFVDPGNTAAKGLFGKAGFKQLYRTLDKKLQSAHVWGEVEFEAEWDELKSSVGFNERRGTARLGYYPVKLTEEVFDELLKSGKVLRCGRAVAVIEESYEVWRGGYTFVFNRYILGEAGNLKPIIEVNPFYLECDVDSLRRLVGYLSTRGAVIIRTYESDPVATKLGLKGWLGAVIMEYSRNI